MLFLPKVSSLKVSIKMAEHNLHGIMTRSKSTRVKEALLAPSKLDTRKVAPDLQPSAPGSDNVQVETVLSPASSSFTAYRDPLLENQATIDLKSQTTFPSASKLDSSPTTGAHSFHAVSAQTCPIIRDLVVCCSGCRVIFQQTANSLSFICPVCSQLRADKERHETALSEFRSNTASILERLADLEKTLLALQTEVSALKSSSTLKNDGLPLPKDLAETSNTIIGSALSANLDEQMDTDSAPATETVSSLHIRGRELDETRDKLESLLDVSSIRMDRLEALCNRAESYLAAIDSNINSIATRDSIPETKSTAQPPKELQTKTAIILGDSNVARFSDLALSMLRKNDRLVVQGNIGGTIAESSDFARKWLRDVKGPALVVLHSGLQDVLSRPLDQIDYTALIDGVCDEVRSLFTDCANSEASLMVCSVPEVVDFISRRDYRKIAYDLNCALESLSLELGFRFLNLTTNIPTHAHLTTYDGLHFNKVGQLTVLKPIVAVVAEWLGIEPDLSIEPSKPSRRQSLYRRKRNSSGFRKGPANLQGSYGNPAQPSMGQELSRGPHSYLRRQRGSNANEYLGRKQYREHETGYQPPTDQYCHYSDSGRQIYMRRATTLGESRRHTRENTRPHGRYVRSSTMMHLNPWLPGFEPYLF